MASTLLYLLTGCAAGFQILSQIVFLVWGRPISYLEITALAGATAVTVAACFVISRPRVATRVALVGSLLLLSYYGFAVATALANVLHFGSQYPLRIFLPALLVLTTTVHAFRSFLINSHPVVRPQRWIIGTLCLGAVAISPLIGFSRTAPFNFTVPRKIVSVEMSWKRGTQIYGPNFISLESPCPNSSDSRCYCGTDFKIINSAAFADHIQSFGSRPVPVKYEVFYDHNGEAKSANLVSVGNWPSEKFHENEGGIGSGGTIRPGEPELASRTPADCFQRLSRH
jgi:hypothetical protein